MAEVICFIKDGTWCFEFQFWENFWREVVKYVFFFLCVFLKEDFLRGSSGFSVKRKFSEEFL